MNDAEKERWERARVMVIDRWRQILDRIEAQDEGGVLRLANVMDEFCEEAIAARQASTGTDKEMDEERGDALVAGSTEIRCRFCRGFIETGGCLGLLDELNRAVLNRHWDTARELARGFITTLEGMDLSHRAGPSVH